MAENPIYTGLNAEQLEAVRHGNSPLLIIAGAGTGKTKTLVHRVAHIIEQGADPSRILLLTFTRRAAAEMLRRVDGLLRKIGNPPVPPLVKGGISPPGRSSRTARSSGTAQLSVKQLWGGTFHAVATRLLRIYGKSIGLNPGFTIHDRSDSEDLLDVVRTELGLAKTDKRFPKKGTCMSIYSHSVNSRRPLEKVLAATWPWCKDYAADLKRLFQGYVDRKESASVLDYDDLLLFWHGMLAEPQAGERIRNRFDHVLVDEYQDTNCLQAEILKLLRPDGDGLTAVGDDAQSIYSFRAATVRNILDFPKQFFGAKVVKLQQNYRSVQPVLEATNRVISQAKERYTKDLWSDRAAGEKPSLVTCEDENEQAEFVVRQILQHREAGIDLRKQAVLFRASHHSIVLEAELARCNIPFVKYGGLKFVEAAHVKDLMAFLRLAENPRDLVAGTRVLTLLPGIGPKKARQLMDLLIEEAGDFHVWQEAAIPHGAVGDWPKFVKLMLRLTSEGKAGSDKGGGDGADVPTQVHLVCKFYLPLLEEKYDHAEPRKRDLEQLEQLASRFNDRATMLAEITLDPPTTTEDFAGDPLLDEDYLILSTIHSAKGLEWDAVYVIHAADGNIPSDMATGTSEQIDEELRLFYVALTRPRTWLYICFPQRYYHAYRGPRSDQYGYAQLTRFISKDVMQQLQCRVPSGRPADADAEELGGPVSKRIRGRVRAIWS